MSTFTRLLFVCLVLSSSSLALAQPASPPARTLPVRVDVDLPSMALGVNTLGDDPVALSLAVGLRVVAASGDGGFFSASLFEGGDHELDLFGPHEAHAGGSLYDLGYLRRFRLTGDDRGGLGLDLQAGLSIGELWFSQPRNGLCFFDCSNPEPVPETVADGLHAGANVGASLDVRAWGFVMGFDVRYRALAAMNERAPGDARMQHVATFGIHIGFGIY